MEFKVPSIACEACGKTITTEIQTHDPQAKVKVNVDTKIVMVETTASETEVQKMIEAVGHTVAE